MKDYKGWNVFERQVFDANGNELPRWLYWDDAASTLMGVPSKKDTGSHHLSVKAIGKHGDTAKDLFIVQVVPEKHEELKHRDGKVRELLVRIPGSVSVAKLIVNYGNTPLAPVQGFPGPNNRYFQQSLPFRRLIAGISSNLLAKFSYFSF